MRSSLGWSLALALLLGLPGASRAEVYEFGVDGSLSLFLPRLGVILSAEDNGSGTAIVYTAPGTTELSALQLPPDLFSTMGASVPQASIPSVGPFTAGVAATFQNGSGIFTGAGFGVSGVMPVTGLFKICLFGTSCSDATGGFSVLLSGDGGPLGSLVGGTVGAGGSFFVEDTGNAFTARVHAGTWAPTAYVSYLTPTTSGTRQTTVYATGTVRGPGGHASTVAQPGGVLQLVTPIRVKTNVVGEFPAFAWMDITFTESSTTTTTSSTTTSTTTTTTTSTTTTTLPGTRVAVCHQSEEEGTSQTVRVPSSALASHLAHGDTLGACVP